MTSVDDGVVHIPIDSGDSTRGGYTKGIGVRGILPKARMCRSASPPHRHAPHGAVVVVVVRARLARRHSTAHRGSRHPPTSPFRGSQSYGLVIGGGMTASVIPSTSTTSR